MRNSKKLDIKNAIVIEGARENNLKNVSLEIPRHKLTVITGLSGSGKSSLAFDTIYAEGQRRYMETLSSYSRQFLGALERPDVDKISGLSPVIAIEQKTTGKNPRSTVGTVTEINQFLRLLFARASVAYSMETGEKMVKYSDAQITDIILEDFNGKNVAMLAPIVKGRKGHYRELFTNLIKKGFTKARIDGTITELDEGMQLDRYKIHNIELVIDRVLIEQDNKERIVQSLSEAMRQGKGTILVAEITKKGESKSPRYFSRNLMCPTTGIAYAEPAPHTFSFNSPSGACQTCGGLGYENVIDTSKIIPNMAKSISDGAIEPLGKFRATSWTHLKLEAILKRYDSTINTPFKKLSQECVNAIINGDSDPVKVNMGSDNYMTQWDGLADYLEKRVDEGDKGKKWGAQYVERIKCHTCQGARLKQESLHFKVGTNNIAQLCEMSIESLLIWAKNIEKELTKKQVAIATEILKEIRERLGFLVDVGLSYLSLSRSSGTLSGGESQRIRLATQIGSKLVNVLYIMDEPSIGLHQRDNQKLINSLLKLRDNGNSVIVVEHDEDMMRAADWIVDVGPKAGRRGGEISAIGTFDDIINSDTLTADYLTGRKCIEIPKVRRKGNGNFITIEKAEGNNLKNVTAKLPLGLLLCITGVSGSGKSSLINGTLRPVLSREFYKSFDIALPHKAIKGIEHVDKMIVVDQSPIGRTPRSNPATYTNLWADIRKLFEASPDAAIRGYTARRFSFNVKGGRCEECKGAGVQTIEMNFLPDVYVKCRTCDGHRYNRETLEVQYKGRNIDEVLDMTVNQSVEFFEHIPNINQKLKAIQDVGLGYVKLGQPCTTLSGGESQRIKLATELAKRDTGNTLYILDEPTTGLHFEDIRILLEAMQKLVDRGNTIIVIEHNLDVIKVADYLIDIGLEGGDAGGEIIAIGTPEQVAKNKKSYTAAHLRPLLQKKQ